MAPAAKAPVQTRLDSGHAIRDEIARCANNTRRWRMRARAPPWPACSPCAPMTSAHSARRCLLQQPLHVQAPLSIISPNPPKTAPLTRPCESGVCLPMGASTALPLGSLPNGQYTLFISRFERKK